MRADRYPYFDAPFIALAHRGGPKLEANRGKENTLTAFRNAVDLGYTHLETDVHLTSDGHLIAFHDEHLDRVTDMTGVIADHTLAELREVTVNGEPIPLMSELLEALPTARFNIDLKAPGTPDALVELLNWHGATSRVCVASFDHERLRRFRTLAGRRVATSVGPRGTMWMMVPLLPRLLPPAGVVMQVPEHHEVAGRAVRVVSPAFITRAHAAGIQVHVWTVDERADMERLIDWGVDGLISDDLVVLKTVLVERGLWREGSALD